MPRAPSAEALLAVCSNGECPGGGDRVQCYIFRPVLTFPLFHQSIRSVISEVNILVSVQVSWCSSAAVSVLSRVFSLFNFCCSQVINTCRSLTFSVCTFYCTVGTAGQLMFWVSVNVPPHLHIKFPGRDRNHVHVSECGH